MNKTKKNWKGALILGLILLFMMSVTALASSDNSLSALNVEKRNRFSGFCVQHLGVRRKGSTGNHRTDPEPHNI